MSKNPTKYKLLQDDFNHATKQLALYRKEIDRLKKENEELSRKEKIMNKENVELLNELAKCRDVLLPTMEEYEDGDNLLCETVADPFCIGNLCSRVAEEFTKLKGGE